MKKINIVIMTMIALVLITMSASADPQDWHAIGEIAGYNDGMAHGIEFPTHVGMNSY